MSTSSTNFCIRGVLRSVRGRAGALGQQAIYGYIAPEDAPESAPIQVRLVSAALGAKAHCLQGQQVCVEGTICSEPQLLESRTTTAPLLVARALEPA